MKSCGGEAKNSSKMGVEKVVALPDFAEIDQCICMIPSSVSHCSGWVRLSSGADAKG